VLARLEGSYDGRHYGRCCNVFRYPRLHAHSLYENQLMTKLKIAFYSELKFRTCPTVVLRRRYIDLSDQMKAYTTSLRRGVKWYRKLAIELLAGSALVNAFILHQEVANEKMSITKFKEEVASNLLQIENQQSNSAVDPVHTLEDVGGNSRRRRRDEHMLKAKHRVRN
jgi:hypothetical protein